MKSLKKVGLCARVICHFADDVAEAGGGEAFETLAVGNNANARHLYRGRREQYALFLGSEEALRAGFLAEKNDGIEHTVV